MSTLGAIVRNNTAATEDEIAWLHQVVGDWQMISDMAFADIVLWVRSNDDAWLAAAHARPSSAGTLFYRDIVGQRIRNAWRDEVDAAFRTATIIDAVNPDAPTESQTRVRAVPVVRRLPAGKTSAPFAVITRHSNMGQDRTPSRQELTFRECANAIFEMIASGDWPSTAVSTGPRRGIPRPSDGLLRLDREGVVDFASPNALSALTRLGFRGELEGRSLAEVTTDLIEEGHDIDESLPLVVTGRAPWRTDVEARGVTVTMLAIPLRKGQERFGAIVLCRDVTELRLQEQTLITKDATIREIHHRVKNNLQTVAALLRIQARRTHSEEARSALTNAERRVASIAVVHDTLSSGLSQSVDFDEVFDRTLKLATEVASINNARVHTERRGSFGVLPSGYATPLALALTELVTNAVEHGLPGRADGLVRITAERDDKRLSVQVCDNGSGFQEGSVGSGLGTQIVKTLITGELSGTIDWGPRDSEGTEVTITVPLQYLERDEA